MASLRACVGFGVRELRQGLQCNHVHRFLRWGRLSREVCRQPLPALQDNMYVCCIGTYHGPRPL